MKNFSVIFAVWGMLLLLTGCAATPAGTDRPAEQPMSQQAAASDAQQRAKVHTELGALYLQKGTVAVALDEGRVALVADPGYAPAHNLMGLAYMQLRENAAAEQSFEAALRLAPNDPEINNSFGWFLCQTGRERRALDYFNVAIRAPLYATPAMPHVNAGICLLRLKDDEAAEDYFSRALRFDPQNTLALFSLADIAYRRGQMTVAQLRLAELDRVTEPGAATLWLALRVARRQGVRDSEKRYAAQLQRNFPGSPEQIKLSRGEYD